MSYKRLAKLLFVFLFILTFLPPPSQAQTLASRLSGRILLQVESRGEAWYVNPVNLQRYYLGRPADAFAIMRSLGLGISNTDLSRIPEAGSSITGDLPLRRRLTGKILLQVQAQGQAWYVNPLNLQRYYLGRPTDAFNLMRSLGLGISNTDLNEIAINEATPQPTAGTRLILATHAPRVVRGTLPDGEKDFGDFDFTKLPALVNAGINEVGAVIEFMTSDTRRQRELRRDFVNAVKPYGIKYYHGVPTYKYFDIIPQNAAPENSNFVGGAICLDEPFAYFPGRDENFGSASAHTSLSASQSYVAYVQRMLTAERRSPTTGGGGRTAPLPIVNTFESLAWYDLKAGADGFWVEGLGGFYLQQIHFFNESFNLAIPETTNNYIRLIAALERGAANNFNKYWGYGIYVGTPPQARQQILRELYDRGATYFFFWANHADGTITTDETIALANYINSYTRTHTPSKTRAKLAILIPAGYHIPGGIYCSNELPDPQECVRAKGAVYTGNDMWNAVPFSNNANDNRILRAFGEAIKQALQSNDEFDILVNDEGLRPSLLSQYERIVKVE